MEAVQTEVGHLSDTPMSFVWEIGHTPDFARHAGAFCLPGHPRCRSYDTSTWAGTTPISIESVRFGDGSMADRWGVVSDYGGTAEIQRFCGPYGGPDCIYPWYSANASGAIHYGVHFPDTVKDLGRAYQFATTARCDGPNGTDTVYCDRIIEP